MTYVGFNPQPNTEDPRAVRAERIESHLDELMRDRTELADALVKYLPPGDVAAILAAALARGLLGSCVSYVRERLGEKMMAEPYDKGDEE